MCPCLFTQQASWQKIDDDKKPDDPPDEEMSISSDCERSEEGEKGDNDDKSLGDTRAMTRAQRYSSLHVMHKCISFERKRVRELFLENLMNILCHAEQLVCSVRYIWDTCFDDLPEEIKQRPFPFNRG